MLRRFRPVLVLSLIAVVWAAATPQSFWPSSRCVTEDRNRDGRPDVWRTYDREGRLAELAIDTNFDGRSDVHEYYQAGALVSRESDRNFDDRVDLVQQFDAATHEQVRAVEDVDFDGTADVLVLFHNGHAVSSRWAHRAVPSVASPASASESVVAPRTADDPLTPVEDPFQNDPAVGAVRLIAAATVCAGTSNAGWLPVTRLDLVVRLRPARALDPTSGCPLSSAPIDLHTPRGPPTRRA